MGEILRIATALAAALLSSLPLVASSSSQAAVSTSSISARCFSYKTDRVTNSVCEYVFEQPFLLKGYSDGGPSVLSYAVRCGPALTWPVNVSAIDDRVGYKRSITVRGSFNVLGGKGAPTAARRCAAQRKMAAFLTVKLKMGRGVTKTNLIVKLDNSLPWGS